MVEKIRAAVVVDKSKMEIQKFEKPHIGPEDGLLKVEMVGVCGTDPGFYSGKVKVADFPIILGHEIVGQIAEIGDVASKRWKVKKADRVIVETVFRCGYCEKCVTGDYRFCERNFGYGTTVSASVPPYLWGGYAEYMYLAPGSMVYKVSEKIPAKAAVLINAVLSNAIRWGRVSGNLSIFDAVVIQGAGPQGLALTIVAKESGCNPIIITGLTKDRKRFELAKEFGADYFIDVEREDVVKIVRDITNGYMADIVVDVAGSPKATLATIDLVKTQGTIVLPTVMGNEVVTPIATDKIVMRDIKVIGQFTSDSRTMGKAIKLVESGKYPIEKIVSHTFALDDAEKAVRTTGGYLQDSYFTKGVIVP
jgi:alcohol dehydrogenase